MSVKFIADALSGFWQPNVWAMLRQALDEKLWSGWTREALWISMQWEMYEFGVKEWQSSYVGIYRHLFPEMDDVPRYPENWA